MADHPMSRVVHLVRRIRPGGHGGTFWPTLLALAESGVPQTVLSMDGAEAERARLLLPQQVRLETADASGGSRVRPRMGRAAVLLRQILAEPESVLSVHLHGVAATLLGGHVLRGWGQDVPLFLHLDRPGVSGRLAQALNGPAYLVRPDRVEPLAGGGMPGAEQLSDPVDGRYFTLERTGQATPLIVTTGRAQDLDHAQSFSQLAVMLSGLPSVEPGQLKFGWIGPAGPQVQAMLKAAQVEVLPGTSVPERLQAFGQAWLYVAPDRTGADVRGVAEAMAAGLPCVAGFAPAYQTLIIHSLSGFLSSRKEDMLRFIARLVDSAELRRDIGLAARMRARHRLGLHRFRVSMRLAHGLSPLADRPGGGMPAPGATGAGTLPVQASAVSGQTPFISG